MPDPLDAKLDLNLRVADLDASIEWYKRIFGDEPIYRGVDRALGGAATALACFRLGGTKLWLMPARAAAAGTQRVGIALMTRQELAPLRAELAARGAQFDDGEVDGHRIEYCRTFACAERQP
jgi:catechol 2,3-dioxygenase-like lactoylglutathione lyase family enzyme